MCGYKKLRNPTSEYWYDIHIPNTSEEVNMQIGSLKFNWSITVLVLYYDQNLCQRKYHMEKDGQDTTQTGRDCQTIDFSTKFNFSITVLVLYYHQNLAKVRKYHMKNDGQDRKSMLQRIGLENFQLLHKPQFTVSSCAK